MMSNVLLCVNDISIRSVHLRVSNYKRISYKWEDFVILKMIHVFENEIWLLFVVKFSFNNKITVVNFLNFYPLKKTFFSNLNFNSQKNSHHRVKHTKQTNNFIKISLL